MDTKRRAPRTLRRLHQGEQYKLYKWLEEQVFNENTTYGSLAMDACAAVGTDVSESSVMSSMKILGLSLPRRKRDFDARLAVSELAKIFARAVSSPDDIVTAVADLHAFIEELK